ncbi:hypothetical protein BS78_05G055000 [Paspalum vaginatum]|nr:hypothetical protein BS78_05G055000 [Paspalum vaginatum]
MVGEHLLHHKPIGLISFYVSFQQALSICMALNPHRFGCPIRSCGHHGAAEPHWHGAMVNRDQFPISSSLILTLLLSSFSLYHAHLLSPIVWGCCRQFLGPLLSI